jgi:hypothetical protein
MSKATEQASTGFLDRAAILAVQDVHTEELFVPEWGGKSSGARPDRQAT